MTKLLFLTSFLFSIVIAKADDLILIKTNSLAEKEYYISNPSFHVHFKSNDFLIASSSAMLKSNMILLDDNAWQEKENYSIVYVENHTKSNYLNNLDAQVSNCYSNDNLVILKHENKIPPAKTDGMIRILPCEIIYKERNTLNSAHVNITDADPFINSLIDQVSQTNLENSIQHMQDYGTRIYDTPEAEEAEQWIKEQFELLGLNVVTQDINYEGSSKNVLAIQEGTLLPDEYILCGAHYDSYSFDDSAPGADDNASGTAGVLEIARILSQYTFNRSIIYCAWTAEEIGLIGSQYYANEAAQNDMNILGYFNLDMIGYLAPESDFHIDLLYNDESEFLANLYKQICDVYLPEVTVERDFLSMGSSDHAAFNSAGFMGIFPFENIPDYSPYIHTEQDLIGLSVNNFDMAEKFVAASLASVATITNITLPPQDFKAMPGNEQVTLNWKTTAGISKYNLYRNNEFIVELDSTKSTYIDNNVENEISYTYKINCISSKTGEESSFITSTTVVPMPELVLPYTNNFDNNINYWWTEGDWAITNEDGALDNTSLTDSPDGAYQPNLNDHITLRSFDIPNTLSSLKASFKVKYELEADFDNVYFEINKNGAWRTLDRYNGTQNTWQEVSYSLNNYVGEDNIQLRFRMYSDGVMEMDGIYIDDFSINEGTVSIDENQLNSDIKLYPNPSKESIMVCGSEILQIEIYSISGSLVEQFPVQLNKIKVDLNSYEKGIYFMNIQTPQKYITERFIVD